MKNNSTVATLIVGLGSIAVIGIITAISSHCSKKAKKKAEEEKAEKAAEKAAFEAEKDEKIEEGHLYEAVSESSIRNSKLDVDSRATAFEMMSELYSNVEKASSRDSLNKAIRTMRGHIDIFKNGDKNEMLAVLKFYTEKRASDIAAREASAVRRHELEMLKTKSDAEKYIAKCQSDTQINLTKARYNSETDKIKLISQAVTGTASAFANTSHKEVLECK